MEVRNMAKSMNELGIKICNRCGKEYTGHPALSRKDNKTKICPECGLKEAISIAKEGLKNEK